MSCVFCQISAGVVPTRIIYRDGDMIVIHGSAPQLFSCAFWAIMQFARGTSH